MLLFSLHFSSTLFMTGLIWFVQVVHYPLFALVPREGFQSYQRYHQRLTTLVVAPVMILEMTTGAWLVSHSSSRAVSLLLPASILLLVIWASTALLQMPLHRRLETEFSELAHGQLVRTNWIRTIAWTVRSFLLLSLLLWGALDFP